MILLRIISSSFKTKSKVIIGVRSTVCYIQLLFILKMIQIVFGTSPSDQLPSWIITTIQNLFYFSDGCGGQYKNRKNFMNLFLHKQDFGLDAEWIFFATSHGKSPCDMIGGSVKCHAAKRSLQRTMNNQILDYQDMLNVCEEEMSKTKLFGISKETMKYRNHLRTVFKGKHCSKYTKKPPLHTTTIIQNCTQAVEWRQVSCWYSWF